MMIWHLERDFDPGDFSGKRMAVELVLVWIERQICWIEKREQINSLIGAITKLSKTESLYQINLMFLSIELIWNQIARTRISRHFVIYGRNR